MTKPKRVGVLSERERERFGLHMDMGLVEGIERAVLLALARMARHEAKTVPAYEGIAEWIREKAKEIPR